MIVEALQLEWLTLLRLDNQVAKKKGRTRRRKRKALRVLRRDHRVKTIPNTTGERTGRRGGGGDMKCIV